MPIWKSYFNIKFQHISHLVCLDTKIFYFLTHNKVSLGILPE